MGKLFEDFEFYDVQATRKEIQDLKDENSDLKNEIIRYRKLLEKNGITLK